MSVFFSPITAAGGNSHAARSARAALQWRDRFGKFIEMGRGIKFKVRRSNGETVNVHGQFVGAVGADKPNLGQVYVSKDPSGLKDGFYQVESRNGAEVLATINPDALEKAGVELGKDAQGNPVGERIGADIQDEATIGFSDSPIGWTKQGNVWVSDDGDYTIMQNTNRALINSGLPLKLVLNGKGVANFKSWADALKRVNERDAADQGQPDPKGAIPLPDEAKARWAAAEAKAKETDKLYAENVTDAKARAKGAVAAYDDAEGSVAAKIDAGESGDAVLTALRAVSPAWVTAEEDYDTKQGVEFPSAEQKAGWTRVENRRKAIANLSDAPAEAPEAPETPEIAPETPENAPETPLYTPELDATGAEIPRDMAGLLARKAFLDRRVERINADSPAFDATYEAQQQIDEAIAAHTSDPSTTPAPTPEAEPTPETPAPVAPEPTPEPEAELPAEPVAPAAPEPLGLLAQIRADSRAMGAAYVDPSMEIYQYGIGDGIQAENQFARTVVGDVFIKKIFAERYPDAAVAEILSNRIARALGIDDITLADVGKDTVVMTKIDGEFGAEVLGKYADTELLDLPNGREMALLDFMIENRDRHGWNWFVSPDNKVIPFDHGLALFNKWTGDRDHDRSGFVQNAIYPNGYDQPLAPIYSKEELEKHRASLAEIKPEFDKYNKQDWYANAMYNLDLVIAAAKPEAATPTAESETPSATPLPDIAPDVPAPAPISTGMQIKIARARDWLEIKKARLEKVKNNEWKRAAEERNVIGQKRAIARLLEEAGLPAEPELADEPAAPAAPAAPEPSAPQILADGEVVDITYLDNAAPGVTVNNGEINYIKVGTDQWNALGTDVIVPNSFLAWNIGNLVAGPKGESTPEPTAAEPDARIAPVVPNISVGKRFTDKNGITYEVARPGMINNIPTPEFVFAKRVRPDGTLVNRAARVNLEGAVPLAEIRTTTPTPATAPAKLRFVRDAFLTKMSYIGENGQVLGTIELSNAGTYDAQFLPDAIGKAFASFSSSDEAAAWLGDRIARENGESVNPITKKAVGVEDPNLVVHVGFSARRFSEPGMANLRNYMESKNISPERRAAIEKLLSNDYVARGQGLIIQRELEALDNLPNTRTKPRPASPTGVKTPVDASLVAAEANDPNRIVDPNLIMQAVKKAHPDFTTLANGDIVVKSRTIDTLKYDLIVRRTSKERFAVFMRETDTTTGFSRIAKISTETHSYAAIVTKLDRGKNAMALPSTAQWFRKQRHIEDIRPEDRGLWTPVPNAIDSLVDGTYVPKTMDAAATAMKAAIVEALDNPTYNKAVLENLARAFALPSNFVDDIIDGINEKKLADELKKLTKNTSEPKPSHITYGGQVLQVGDWVDWTDWNEQSPTYGQVFRGQVRNLLEKAAGGGNPKYVYSDHALIVFPEYNRLMGARKPGSQQRDRVASNLVVVDSKDATPTPAFFAKKKELVDQDRIAGPAEFGVPTSGTTTTPRPASAPVAEVDPDSVALPFDMISLAEWVDARELESLRPEAIEFGDIIAKLNAGAVEHALVTESTATPAGQVITTVTPDAEGGLVQKSVTFAPAAPAMAVFAPGSLPPLDVFKPRAKWEFDKVSEAQVRMLHRLKREKMMSPATRAQVEAALGNADLTKGEASDIISELLSRKNKAKMNTDDRVLANVQAAIDILDGGAKAGAVRMEAEVARAPQPPATDPYDGYKIKKIAFEDIKARAARDPFVNIPKASNSQLRVGDLVPTGMGIGRMYYQLVEDLGGGRFRARRVLNTRDAAYDQLNGKYTDFRPGGWEGRVKNVKRPSKAMPADYNIGTPQKTAEPEKAMVLGDGSGEYGARAQDLADAYNAPGKRTIVKRINEGAINMFAQIERLADGREVFSKGVKNKEEFDKEIVANRVAFELGLTDLVVIGLGDNSTLVMTQAQGDMARNRHAEADDIMQNPDRHPKARLIGLLDYLIQNLDRHRGNWMVDNDGEPVAIDHGNIYFGDVWGEAHRAFAGPALGLLNGGRGEPKFTESELLGFRVRLAALQKDFAERGRDNWHTYVMSQLTLAIGAVRK